MLNTDELLESFMYYASIYLGILALGFNSGPDTFMPYLKVVSVAFAIPLILALIAIALIPIMGYFDRNGLRILESPLDDGSFIVVIILAPIVSMFIFGMAYTVASTFIPFLPYPLAFQ